ncbi:uncharacterized protein MYCFIDRAFT_204350 [Pseudocercospora fijiensis CIRAD86]|uniref:Uncharacterized protein n=1 Tax=Pseudocercospora fijiensis (strain CIRAD86) TaxID=383855 RepID=M3AAB9_PSEFD|nr:uncharacterized protein MYCFIDRAFT_204350 [Pseudocercospora fijiensis CIRAD86]EME81556.1 hypothetical protein MYCFIDRAFT_204350 [Pseudocercospora fijiensis CIRAD86]
MSITQELLINAHPGPRKVVHPSSSKLSAKSNRSHGHGDPSSNGPIKSRKNASHSAFRKEILYRAVNEHQLQASMLNAYADLLERLGFDLNAYISNGQTWYLCKGKQDNKSSCQRLIPEVYLEASIGEILKAADTTETTGDSLVDHLANALSYAICEHHKEIHRFVRAIEMRQIIEQWRASKHIPKESTDSTKEESLSTEAFPMPNSTPVSPRPMINGPLAATLETSHSTESKSEPQMPAQSGTPPGTLQTTEHNSETKGDKSSDHIQNKPRPRRSKEDDRISDKQVVEGSEGPEEEEDELAFSKKPKEILEVEKAFQSYLRAGNAREARSGSNASSGESSAGSRSSFTRSLRPRAESLHVSMIADEAQ